MSWQSLKLSAHINELSCVLVIFIFIFKLRIHNKSFINGHIQFRRNHLGYPVSICIGHIKGSSHVFYCCPCGHGSESNYLCNLVTAILLSNIVYYFLSSFVGKVHVNIGHTYTLGIQESFKYQIIFYRVYGRYIQRISNHASRGASPSRSDCYAVIFCKFDIVPYNKEIIHISHFYNGIKLIFKSFLKFVTGVGISFQKSVVCYLFKIFLCCISFRHLIFWKLQFVESKFHVASLGYFFRIFQCLGNIGKQLIHFFRTF